FIVTFAVLFVPFYAEILLAAVFALAIEPTLGKLLQRRQLRWRTSVALILAGMFVLIAAPVTMVAYKGYVTIVEISKTGFQNTEIFQKLTFIKGETLKIVNRLINRFGLGVDLQELSGDSISTVANTVLGFVSHLINQIPSILLSVFV